MTGHLVLPVRTPMAPRDLREQLALAHAFLVTAARATVPRLSELSPESWGIDAKREHVRLPGGIRPRLVSPTITTHSFAEVVNQSATLERLLDALTWAETFGDLEGASVMTCNPTTSSAPMLQGDAQREDDHDLVLEGRDGALFRFEVSDVAGQNDGNGKEKKDLVALGVLRRDDAVVAWPSGRLFLVVSPELAAILRRPTRHGLKRGLFHYAEMTLDGRTRIFEVRQGAPPLGFGRS